MINVKITDTDEQSKIEALAKHLECSIEEAEERMGDYMVLTDSEADEAAKEDIEQSLWAFRCSFLAAYSSVADESVFQAIVDNGKCEDNNVAIKKLINDFDHFVSDAIRYDGRGHFLSGYDGEEHEVDGLYIYRTN